MKKSLIYDIEPETIFHMNEEYMWFHTKYITCNKLSMGHSKSYLQIFFNGGHAWNCEQS